MHTRVRIVASQCLPHVPAFNNKTQQLESQVVTEKVVVAMSHDKKVSTSNVAQQMHPLQALYQWANAVLDAETCDILEYWHLLKKPKHLEAWSYFTTNEFGLLVQEVGNWVKGMNTIFL